MVSAIFVAQPPKAVIRNFQVVREKKKLSAYILQKKNRKIQAF
jgi:hypothetical protein